MYKTHKTLTSDGIHPTDDGVKCSVDIYFRIQFGSSNIKMIECEILPIVRF